MALGEERNEQNSQAWRARVERERLDLSASVEAALLDNGHVVASQWDEDLDEQDASQPITSGTGLVPPRLSLQSRTLPIVQPQRAVTTITDAYQATSSHVIEEAEQQSVPSVQPSGMLARLAHRFTSSFASVKPELPQQQTAFVSSPSSLSQDMMETYQSTPAGNQLSSPLVSAGPPLVRVIDTVMSPNPVEKETRVTPQKRRSLKRNGKVLLQTTEQPAITKVSLPPRVEEQETGATLVADVRNALNEQSPLVPEQRELPLPVAPVPAYGSGAFESEQSDVMIANSLVTASSVVMVTLTTNPGPVVVQYISLQPQVGFTVHLTAPVTTRTAFNYVMLPGETSVAASIH